MVLHCEERAWCRASTQSELRVQTPRETKLNLSGLHILIVEDQILIALDLEATLTDAGADSVITSSSQSDGLLQIELRKPDVAILDVSLGDETSLPVAEALLSQNVPFVFATGYGEDGIIPPHLSAFPVVTKPYDSATILNSIRDALKR